ncbi:MAG: hypothetical protein JRJ86_12135 [Deltaproteobacteria bacterium]|nr:hypothetical protein [Deltaproteobacteria bacterium]MBW2117680.1 hypothetical protein [Deltaproteobacteria bacterium]MBW2344834.1 hypothetical protein [Deltaproteobacteria bacterium]
MMRLNISNLIIHMDLSGLKPKLCQELAEMFSPFISNNGYSPHETLDVVPLKTRIGKRPHPDLVEFARQSLKVPLSKFPFTTDLKKETGKTLKRMRRFLGHAEFNDLLKGSKCPEEVVFYPFKMSCLIQKRVSAKSTLFLKAGCRTRTKLASIYGAAYFIACTALPLLAGIMLHGVGIKRKGAGCLFLGLSGDGKTTLAELSEPERVISDDAVIVEKKGSRYFLVPTPFDQLSCSNQDIRLSPSGRTKLSIGFFLEKDTEVYLEKISRVDSCSFILKNHIHFFRYFSPEVVEKAFYLVAGLCRQVPFYRLHFKKDTSFWPLIEEELTKIEE